jgi:hypothetical protein
MAIDVLAVLNDQDDVSSPDVVCCEYQTNACVALLNQRNNKPVSLM